MWNINKKLAHVVVRHLIEGDAAGILFTFKPVNGRQ